MDGWKRQERGGETAVVYVHVSKFNETSLNICMYAPYFECCLFVFDGDIACPSQRYLGCRYHIISTLYLNFKLDNVLHFYIIRIFSDTSRVWLV